jgi:hypothetical protein
MLEFSVVIMAWDDLNHFFFYFSEFIVFCVKIWFLAATHNTPLCKQLEYWPKEKESVTISSVKEKL